MKKASLISSFVIVIRDFGVWTKITEAVIDGALACGTR